tara:strand:- start:2997 stop:3698 length:702 start_codon:yes stop_codon:yes gene_type:complete
MDTTLTTAISDFEAKNIATGANIDLVQWSFSLFILIFLLLIIQYSYNNYATTVSNHKSFSNLFLLFGLSTFLIISVIKVSLILSLGLVGALSIVRFRAAIKEPEQIVYLFLLIGVAISVGANQLIIASIITFICCFIGYFNSKTKNKILGECDYLKIIFSSKISAEKQFELLNLIENSENNSNLIRLIDDNENTEITLGISFDNFSQLKTLKDRLSNIDENVAVSYISSKNVQ